MDERRVGTGSFVPTAFERFREEVCCFLALEWWARKGLVPTILWQNRT